MSLPVPTPERASFVSGSVAWWPIPERSNHVNGVTLSVLPVGSLQSRLPLNVACCVGLDATPSAVYWPSCHAVDVVPLPLLAWVSVEKSRPTVCWDVVPSLITSDVL